MNIINIYFDKSRLYRNYYYNENPFFEYFKEINQIENINTKLELHNIYRILNHNEYIVWKYFETFLTSIKEIEYKNLVLNITENRNIADIEITDLIDQGFKLINIKNNKTLVFNIEDRTGGRDADIPIPYFTGLYIKKTIDKKLKFTELLNKKKYFLSYIGGVWRGPRDNNNTPKRKLAIDIFFSLNKKNTEKYKELFFAPLIANTHKQEGELGWNKGSFGIKAKDIYYDSLFSWQPEGDTPTRRGFYESILCGCIPIINITSFNIYKKLLIGEENVKNIAIIIDDANYYNGNYVFNYLLGLNKDKIMEYRNNINKIKDRLQWNIFNNENAFIDAIKKIL
tara:strand:+ start:1698 stop:2717 length:1020 start_codon:yes stop_codon:yes gene_type:complete